MFRADRFTALLEQLGLSQSELARRVGVSQTTIWKLSKEPTQGSKHLHRIAAALGVSPAYLAGETDDASPTAPTAPLQSITDIASMLGLVPVRELDLTLGLNLPDLTALVGEEVRLFPESWLRQFTNAPAHSTFFAKGAGDAMMPTLSPNDTMLVDASCQQLTMADQIWACTHAGLCMVKRLRPRPDGTIQILSDNPTVAAYTAAAGDVHLIGRVVAVIRSL